MTQPVPATVSGVLTRINQAARAQQAVQDAARAVAAEVAADRAAAATSEPPTGQA